MLSIRIYLVIFLITVNGAVNANNELKDTSDFILLKNIKVFVDSTNEFTSKDYNKMDFEKSELDVPNLQAQDASFWFKFSIESNTISSNQLLMIDNPVLSQLTLFRFNDNSISDSSYLSNNMSFNSRKYFSQSFVFDVSLNKGKNDFLLKVTSGNQVLLPIKIMTKEFFYKEQSIKDVVFGLYFGIILVMILYNLILFFL